jgi:hypothetical protein
VVKPKSSEWTIVSAAHRRDRPNLIVNGTHACVGAALVRPIAAAVLKQLYTRWPGLRAIHPEDAIAWRSGFRHRGPLALPVKLGESGTSHRSTTRSSQRLSDHRPR